MTTGELEDAIRTEIADAFEQFGELIRKANPFINPRAAEEAASKATAATARG